MGDPVFKSSQFAAFAAAIRKRESSDNFSDTKNPGYLRAYQMGSLALQDAGFQDKSGNWTTLARSFGVNSDSTFRSHPAAQDAAFQNYAERNFEYLHN